MAQRDGLVGIINGTVKIVNPLEGGTPAQLIPPDEGGVIFINGLQAESQISCAEHDIVTIEPVSYLEEPRVEVNISPDGLSAMAAVFPGIITTYQVEDAELAPCLKPSFVRTRNIDKVITLEQLVQELHENKILAGLNTAAMEELLLKADGEFMLVAEGRPVEEGTDGSVEFFSSHEVELVSYEDDAMKADYREKFRYPAVKRGDIIAAVHPPREGKVGLKVTGEAIIPKHVKEARVRCGEGVLPPNERREIIAIKDGRLIVTGSQIRVASLLVHNGDVNMESGNLRFNGAIRIFGSVMEGMKVEARDSITIEGSCFGATLKAGGGINVRKNIIQCEVQGGLFFDLISGVVELVSQLKEEIEVLKNKLKQLLEQLAEKGQEIDREFLKRIVALLLDKNTAIKEKLEALMQKLANSDYPYLDDTLRTLKRLKDILSIRAQGNQDIEDLMKMDKSLHLHVIDYIELLAKIPPLTAAYVQNSNIAHSGDITVSGSGCYFSALKSGGGVMVSGVFRGGNIRAEGNVKVKEFISISSTSEGADKKTAARVRVSERATISFGLVHEDTTVQIGKMFYRFEQALPKIRIKYDPQEGMLKLSNY